MALQSQLFRGDRALEAAAVSDPAHIKLGATGEHVSKIQTALTLVDGADISSDDRQRGHYGASTAAAVLAYKRKRNIVNLTYETQADDIVGKMTIVALDGDVLQRESIPDRRVRIVPNSAWIMATPGHIAPFHQLQAFAVGASAGSAARRHKIPSFVEHELTLRTGGIGKITVIDGSPGKLSASEDPFTGAVVQLEGAPEKFDAFGNAFLEVTKDSQSFTVKAGSTPGTTSIIAQRETLRGISTATINVTVKGVLAGRVVAAPDDAIGFDTGQIVNADAAKKFKAHNFQYCLRYLSLNPKQGPKDLTDTEANGILSAGLGLMAVQHVRKVSWRPTAAMGLGDGKHAVKHAIEVGLPPGVCVFIDLEDVDQTAQFSDVMDFCTKWADVVAAAGYRPGVYVGANNIPITSKQLASLPVVHYWKSGSTVPDVEGIGYQMVQKINPPERHFGIDIDRDTTHVDKDGRRVHWLARVKDSPTV
jgi:peptidoglycan hydrolase-like protein with peptidoglycan-binding domain